MDRHDTGDIAAALQRVEAVLRRRPEAGLHDDEPALARWQGGTRVVASHADGTFVETELPQELGGRGDRPSPGWLAMAGLAACAATRLAMAAAAEGIVLERLEVEATGRSDARGVFGLADGDGGAVSPAPRALALHVRVAAAGVAPERLRALVEHSQRLSPVGRSMQEPLPLTLRIEIGEPPEKLRTS